MSLNDLSKEQKQYLVLGLLAVIVVLALLTLGIRFSLSSIRVARTELDGLTSKIESADQILKKQNQVNTEYMHTMALLKKQIDKMPPERNYYSWATEVIYSQARAVGLEIDTIDEIGGAQKKPVGNAATGSSLESYALKISAHGGYESVKVFIS